MQSKDIVFVSTPDIAENGAVVPIGITSKVPKTRVDRDPHREESEHARGGVRHSAGDRARAVDAHEDGRRASNVYALVKADGKYYVASKEIKVTLGGCGG